MHWPYWHTNETLPLAAAASASVEAPDEPPADWCAPAYEPIAGGGCFAAAPATGAAMPLLVYLHGRYARSSSAEEIDRQRRLAARATAHGFAVLVLRGGLGACSAPELADWFCWPSNEHNADSAAVVVQAWTRALAAAHERTRSNARVLLGFSNGGYFAGLLATRGLFDADAVVIAHGGPVEPFHAPDAGPPAARPPLLLLSADDDVAQDEMILFDEVLGREHWPHDSYARPGVHGLTDEDIDAALSFFARARESLPLDPPLSMHRAVRHARLPPPTPDALEPSPPLDDSGSTPAAIDVDAP